MRTLQMHFNRSWKHPSPQSVMIDIPSDCREDLLWWSHQANLRAGKEFARRSAHVRLFTDASLDGWAATMLDLKIQGDWNSDERQLSINLLELRAIRLGLQAFQLRLRGLNVGIMADNTTALAYIRNEGGTRSFSLNREAQLVLEWAESLDVQLLPQYIQGKLNVDADTLSRKNKPIQTK